MSKLSLPLIVIAAALLRARYLLYIEFNVDQAYPMWQALTTLDAGAWPLVGQSTSVLFGNPPLTGYLFLPLVALARLPLTPYLLTVPLNTLGVLLGYRALRTALGRDPALIGAFLMAVNPWMIEYSRTAWVQSLLPFCVPALAWAFFPVWMGKARHPARRTILGFALLAVTVNTYLLAYLLVIPVGLLTLIGWRRVPKRALLIGCAILFGAAALYGAGLLTQANTVTGRVESFTAQPPRLSDEAWSHAVRLVTGGDYALARGTQAPIRDSMQRQAFSQAGHYVLLAALVIGGAAALVRILRRRDPGALIVLVWFGLPILAMSYVGQVIHPFYQLLGVPGGAGLAGLGIVTVIGRGGRAAWGVTAAVLIAFGGLSAINSGRYAEETAAIPGAHGLTALPLRWALPLGGAIADQLAAGGRVFTALDQPFVLSSSAGRVIDQQPDLAQIIPAQASLRVSADSLNTDDDPTITRFVLPDGTTLEIARVPPDDGAHLYAHPDPVLLNLRSDHGITASLAAVESSPDGVRIDTYWRVDERIDGIDGTTFGAFVHLFAADGTRIAELSGGVIPGVYWRAGDLHRYTFESPLQPHSIGIGLYDPNRGINVIFITPDGTYTPILMLPRWWRGSPR
ncbi:MAG: hypothetical protein SF162_12225 [bacterium]|nr:hypothetical protein [bacterium]